MRRVLTVGIASAAVATLGLIAPAVANASGSSGNTSVTFSLTGGSLFISTPASATLSSGGGLTIGGGNSVSGSLGTTTVTDNRGALLGSTDTVDVSSTDFTTGTDPSTYTIPAGDATFNPGALVGSLSLNGVSLGTGSQVTLSSTAQQTAQVTGVLGSASFSYNPTVSVTVPAAAPAGTYSGTVTQSVS